MTSRTKWRLVAWSAGALGILGSLTILCVSAVRIHAWAVIGLLSLYFVPFGIVAALAIRPLILFVRLKDAEDTIEQRYKAWWLPIKARLARDEADPMSGTCRFLLGLLLTARIVAYLPFLTLQVAIWLRSGAHGRPRNREATWSCIIIAGAYFASTSRHMLTGCVIAFVLIMAALSGIIDVLLVEDGVAAIFMYRKYQVGVSFIAKMALTIVFGFACIHFSISQTNSRTYNLPLSVLDSIYFSVVTFATVGYGDIYPVTPAAKIACMSEIATGELILVVALNVIASVWLKGHEPVVTEQRKLH